MRGESSDEQKLKRGCYLHPREVLPYPDLLPGRKKEQLTASKEFTSDMERLNVDRARALRRNMTDAERLLWHHLRDRRLSGWKFRRQHEIDRYIVDFVCADAR